MTASEPRASSPLLAETLRDDPSLQVLFRAARRTSSGVLLAIETSSPNLVEPVVEIVMASKRAIDPAVAEPFRIQPLRAMWTPVGDEALREHLATMVLAPLLDEAAKRRPLTVLDTTVANAEQRLVWVWLLRRLNERRDLILRDRAGPVLWFVPTWLLDIAALEAADWRSVVAFSVTLPHVADSMAAIPLEPVFADRSSTVASRESLAKELAQLRKRLDEDPSQLAHQRAFVLASLRTAQVEAESGRPSEALSLLDDARRWIDAIRRNGNETASDWGASIAEIEARAYALRALGRFDEAERLLRGAIDDSTKLDPAQFDRPTGHRMITSKLGSDLATLLQLQQRWSDALVVLDAADRSLEPLLEEQSENSLYASLAIDLAVLRAESLLRVNDDKNALATAHDVVRCAIDRAQDAFGERFDVRLGASLSRAERMRSWFLVRDGDSDAAIAALDRAERALRALPSGLEEDSERFAITHQRAMIELSRGRVADSLRASEQALALVDKMRSVVPNRARMDSFSAIAHGAKAYALTAMDRAADAKSEWRLALAFVEARADRELDQSPMMRELARTARAALADG